jgi:hypothetical protein
MVRAKVAWLWCAGAAMAMLGGCRTSASGLEELNDRTTPVDAATSFRDAPPVACAEAPEGKKPDGSKCGCTEECESGFCVDGVCCNTACDDLCRACNVPGSPGICSFIPAGSPPALPGQCEADAPESCGRDGTCDGAGACRKHPDGTACKAGRCEGSAVVGAGVCADGACQDGPTVPCSPFACDPSAGRCFATCSSARECDGRACAQKTCGAKPLGAECSQDGECESGSCADKVCCNLACSGACVSCNQPGKLGQCLAVAVGAADPHGVCKAEAPESCGLSGRCNGVGGCARHPSGTICKEASCTSGTEVTASTCDGAGSCRPGASVSCAPFTCAGSACSNRCASDAECLAGNVCVEGSCGKKQNGRACKAGGECRSGFCADGVCCESACGEACSFCAYASSPGRCVPVPVNTVDPRGGCVDKGVASCGNNGTCNGNRACALYPNGSVCRSASCDAASNAYTQPSTCRDGACVNPAPVGCAPFKCSGNACSIACAADGDCASPSTCRKGSCGKKGVGALCSKDDECAQNICAQGVCCATKCGGSCLSCNLPGTVGTCAPVAAGAVDPAGVCRDQGASSCGGDGTCDGRGSCRLYPAGVVCAAGSCTDGSQRGTSTCDGLGKCTPGAARPCSPYACNAVTASCQGSCVDDRQCAAPYRCDTSGHCGKKQNGAPCAEKTECESNACVEGVCCNSECGTLCRSCVVGGAVGTCTNVPHGSADPRGGCAVTAQSSCGSDGTCNGAAACAKWAPGTSCRSAVCSADGASSTAAGSCDGAGSCPAGVVTSCGAYRCNVGTGLCRTNCVGPADCAAEKSCVAGSCV